MGKTRKNLKKNHKKNLENNNDFIQPLVNNHISNVGSLVGTSSLLYKNIFSVFPAGIIILDEHGIVTDLNFFASELFDFPLSGKKWSEVIPEAFAPREDDGHEISLKNGKRVQISTRSLYPELGQLLVITDLSETRAWQEQQKETQRLCEMGRMIAQLAHQVRTPIASALLYTSNLKKFVSHQEKQSNYVEKILNQLRLLERQIKDMLLFAKGGGYCS